MNPDWLLKHFEQISEAPDAVPRLRRFILDLAVRGRLVEQDPADEPASELLRRIEAEKERLTKAGELRKHHTQPLDEEQITFTIPSVWSWTQLAQIGIINPQNDSEDNTEASFVPMRMIYAEYGQPSDHETRSWGEIRKGFTHFADGDVGLAKITPCFENGKSTVFRNLTGGIGAGTTELHVVRPILVIADYILIFLKSPHFVEAGIPKMTGTAGQKRVPKDYLAFSPFPLPPLAEQHRIVAKVDELMALCDELEAAQIKRERRRDRLVAATLHGLNNGDDSSEPGVHPTFEESARCYFNHLPRLTARPEHIQQLRQTILNLAVHGKLVPQDPNDEPAGELLCHIEIERQRLIAEGTIKRINSLPLTSEEENPFDLPPNWLWERFGNVAAIQSNLVKPQDYPKHPHIAPDNIESRTGKLLPYVTVAESKVSSAKHLFFPNSVIYSKIRPNLAKATIVDFEGLCSADAYPIYPLLNIRYLLKFMLSDVFVSQSVKEDNRVAMPKINQEALNKILVAVPPLNEQDRIVVKVDELMALCDELEFRLTTTATARRQLLEATLHEALKQRSLHEVSYEN